MWYILSGIFGGFIGVFLRGAADFIWKYFLPSRLTWWAQMRRERLEFDSAVRAPSIAAVMDLQTRIWNIVEERQHEEYKNADNPNFYDYYITSTAYLFAQLFAYGEILRRKASALDHKKLNDTLRKVGGAIDEDPKFRIFALQQREIGQCILIPSLQNQDGYEILEYINFIKMLNGKNVPSCISQLLENVRTLFEGDLPKEALANIQRSLIKVMKDYFDPKYKWIAKDDRESIKLP